MKSTMRAGRGTETLTGWAMETESGQRTFFPNASEGMRARIARKYDKVEWIRGYVVEDGVRVILA